MSASIVLLLLSPILLLMVVFGVVVLVALYRARPEDIPKVLAATTGVFRRLADRVPSPRVAAIDSPDQPSGGHHEQLPEEQSEEAR